MLTTNTKIVVTRAGKILIPPGGGLPSGVGANDAVMLVSPKIVLSYPFAHFSITIGTDIRATIYSRTCTYRNNVPVHGTPGRTHPSGITPRQVLP